MAQVKHFKGGLDAKRGKIFSKIKQEIRCVKNWRWRFQYDPRLRWVLKSRAANMPNDNIERRSRKGPAAARRQTLRT